MVIRERPFGLRILQLSCRDDESSQVNDTFVSVPTHSLLTVWAKQHSGDDSEEPGEIARLRRLRVGFESHEARAIRRTRSMTEAA
jgi:hypothetical protein